MPDRRHVTVVVPLYQSAATVRELALRLHGALDPFPGWSWDLVLVDDACPQGSGAAARELAADDPVVRLVTHRANQGQHRAVLTGLAHAGGEWAVVMDGDLQDRPEDVPHLLAAATESGAEAVFAGRRGRYESAGRRLTSWAFRRLRHWTAGVPHDAGLFVALSRRMREAVAGLDDDRPSVVMMVGLSGLPVASIPIERSPREQGRSAYRGSMRAAVAFDALRFALHHRLLGRGRGRPPALDDLLYESGADPYEEGATSEISQPEESGGTSYEAAADSKHRRPDESGAGSTWLRATAFLVAVALLYELVYRLAPPPPLGLGDEGFRFLLSRAWARGVSLFATFQLLYLPGEYAWFGSWLAAFGTTVPTLRVAGRCLAVLAIAIFCAAARNGVGGGVGTAIGTAARPETKRRPGRRTWLAAGLAAALAVVAIPAPKTLAAALVLAASLPLFRRETPGRRDLFLAAVLAGLLAAVREDSAVLAGLLALGLAVRRTLPSAAAEPRGPSARPRSAARAAARAVSTILAGILAGFLPWAALFAARGELAGLLAHLGRRLTFLVTRLGDPSEVAAAAPGALATHAWWQPRGGWTIDAAGAALLPAARLLVPAWYGGLAAWLVVTRLRRRPWTGLHRGALAALVLGVGYLPQFVWERPDLEHLRDHAAVLLTGLALLAGGTAREAGARRRSNRSFPRLAGAVLALFLMIFAAGFGARALGRGRYPAVPYPTPAARAIEAGIPPPPPAWAGLPREAGDTLIVLTWGAGWYALEGMEPGTRHLSTYLRHTDHPEEVAELRADLARPANRWVILHRRGEIPEEVRARVPELYRRLDAWQGWELWERRDAASPARP